MEPKLKYFCGDELRPFPMILKIPNCRFMFGKVIYV